MRITMFVSARLLFIVILQICIILVLGSDTVYAQQFSREEVVAALIFNFAQNVEWRNEEAIDRFHFKVITSQKKMAEELNKISRVKKIRKKFATIVAEAKLSNTDNVHLIFVAKDKEELFADIFKKTEGSNILLITEEYADKRKVMINLFETEDYRIKFEINKANIINQDIKVLPEMVLLGGTEIDVAKIYKESQDVLRSKEEQIAALQQRLDLLNLQIKTSREQIAEHQMIIGQQKHEILLQKKKISNQQRDILQQQNQIKDKQRDILAQQQQIENQQFELQRLLTNVKDQEDTLARQTVLLADSRQLLKQQQSEIEHGKKVLLSQNSKIESQNAAIILQKKVLAEQGTTIEAQKKTLYLFMVIILLAFGLLYTIFLAYRNKQRSNKQLQEQKDKLQETLEVLEIAERKAQQYLDVAGVILVVIDTNQKVILINQKGCEVLGYCLEEMIGKNWFETFVPENIRPDTIKVFSQLIAGATEPGGYYENPVISGGGEEHLIAWHHVMLKDEEGNVIGTLSSGEDITAQKRSEAQIYQLNCDLQDRAAALETANQELEAFAYSVSHDLRAPLRHIDGFMELLQKQTEMSLDEKSKHYMQTILNASKRMGLLIDDLLSFSRMGRSAISKQTVDIGELVREVIRELEPDAAGRNIDWRIERLLEITGDRAMLRMVFVNLISNALKFTRPREQAQIEIDCRDQETETVFYIRDNGTGFDMAYADNLFGVFQRLHRADEFEGTGIGLANVRRIISRHGGRTWAEGEIDRGAVFYFSLPKSVQEA